VSSLVNHIAVTVTSSAGTVVAQAHSTKSYHGFDVVLFGIGDSNFNDTLSTGVPQSGS
jgi:hypothetical protein